MILFVALLSIVANWAFKLFFGWLVYLLCQSFGASEWLTIAAVAIAASEAKLELKWRYST